MCVRIKAGLEVKFYLLLLDAYMLDGMGLFITNRDSEFLSGFF